MEKEETDQKAQLAVTAISFPCDLGQAALPFQPFISSSQVVLVVVPDRHERVLLSHSLAPPPPGSPPWHPLIWIRCLLGAPTGLALRPCPPPCPDGSEPLPSNDGCVSPPGPGGPGPGLSTRGAQHGPGTDLLNPIHTVHILHFSLFEPVHTWQVALEGTFFLVCFCPLLPSCPAASSGHRMKTARP